MHLSLEFFAPGRGADRPSPPSKDSLLAYYLLFLGHLSASGRGDRLLDSFKLYELAARVCEQSPRLAECRLVVAAFDVYAASKARLLLEKCLLRRCGGAAEGAEGAEGAEEARRALLQFKSYVLTLIYNMFRANHARFEAFFVEILVNAIAASEIFSEQEQSAQRGERERP
jgi:hypothetical protein